MKYLIPLAVLSIAASAQADVKRSTNMLRDAITPLTLLQDEGTIRLTGESDDEEAEATVTLGKDGKLEVVRVMQDAVPLHLPDAAWQGMQGAAQAWLEERGADLTLVIEGEDDDGEWRLALIFADKTERLRKRRLSREGVKRDHFTFYSRDEEDYSEVVEEEQRGSHGRGFYNS